MLVIHGSLTYTNRQPSFRVVLILILFVKRLLPLPIVPIERSRNAINPVFTFSIQGKDTRERKTACRDSHIVSWLQFGSGQWKC